MSYFFLSLLPVLFLHSLPNKPWVLILIIGNAFLQGFLFGTVNKIKLALRDIDIEF